MPEPEKNERPAPAVELYTVHAFRDDKRDERAEQLAMKQGFIPGEKERAEGAAQRCNQLSLIGVEFKAVSCEQAVKEAVKSSADQANKGDAS